MSENQDTPNPEETINQEEIKGVVIEFKKECPKFFSPTTVQPQLRELQLL